MTSSEFVGQEFEKAYAKVFQGAIVGGFNDHGHDVAIAGFGFVQIKASVDGLRNFLTESLRQKKFIPVCVGEPGKKAEMLSSLRDFGGWVGKEIPRRLQLLAGIAQVKNLCK
ncbi:MAG: hypothetical protein WC666_01910 [Candidatus Paceibacterota bacterium]|jgi:hypothetical protein